jgi:class 3 adenylate cyclase
MAAVPVNDPEVIRAPGIEDLKIWGRFHVRLTLFYGSVVLAALGVMTVVLYIGGVQLAMDGIRARIGATALSIARGVDPDKLAELQVEADSAKPAYAELREDFRGVVAAEKDIVSISILVPTGSPGLFRFAFDYVAPGKSAESPAKVGQAYDARTNATLQQGMNDLSVETEVASDAWGDTLSGFAPVIDAHGKHVALVGVDGDARAIALVKRRIFLGATGLCLVAAIVLGFTGFFVGRNVHDPVTRLMDAARAIAAGKLETRARIDRTDEFGLLGDHFDLMAHGLQERDRIRTTFGRYVSEDVAKRVLSGPDGARMGGEVREVTVLFSDLRGYSTISETLSPTDTVEFLNEYLSAMNQVIDAHGGVIIEFLGDAILAVFGAPSDLEGHPERAVRCAMAMRDALAVFNEKMSGEGRAPWEKNGMRALGQRIGIHTGEVVAGNLGSRVRVKYAVIGDAVNVASRCEGLNKALGTDILCTSATWERLPAELKARLTDMGAHEVKGRAQKVAVFSA